MMMIEKHSAQTGADLDALSTMTDVIRDVMTTTIVKSRTKSAADVTAIALTAVIASLSPVFQVVGDTPEVAGQPGMIDANDSTGLNKGSVLFATLLTVASLRYEKRTSEDHGIALSFGPHAVFRAKQMYEALTGEKPDDYLNPSLVKMAEMYQELQSWEASQPLGPFLLSQAERPPERPAYLN